MSTASSADKSPSFEKTWGSSTSSGYCSDEAADSDAEFEQYFTARTSFFPKSRKANSDVKKVRGKTNNQKLEKKIRTNKIDGNVEVVLRFRLLDRSTKNSQLSLNAFSTGSQVRVWPFLVLFLFKTEVIGIYMVFFL